MKNKTPEIRKRHETWTTTCGMLGQCLADAIGLAAINKHQTRAAIGTKGAYLWNVPPPARARQTQGQCATPARISWQRQAASPPPVAQDLAAQGLATAVASTGVTRHVGMLLPPIPPTAARTKMLTPGVNRFKRRDAACERSCPGRAWGAPGACQGRRATKQAMQNWFAASWYIS